MQRRSVRAGWVVSGGGREHVDADGGLVSSSVDGGSACVVLGDRAFDDAVFGADPPGGQKLGQHMAADDCDQVDGGVGDDALRQDELVAGGGDRATVKPARSGSVAAMLSVASVVVVRSAWQAAGRAQTSCSTPAGVRGPQDPSAQDRGLQLRVGCLGLPALVAEPDARGPGEPWGR